MHFKDSTFDDQKIILVACIWSMKFSSPWRHCALTGATSCLQCGQFFDAGINILIHLWRKMISLISLYKWLFETKFLLKVGYKSLFHLAKHLRWNFCLQQASVGRLWPSSKLIMHLHNTWKKDKKDMSSIRYSILLKKTQMHKIKVQAADRGQFNM